MSTETAQPIKLIRPILLTLALNGCGGTSVLLIPDPDGKVGEVVMETAAGAQVLTRTNQSAEAAKPNEKPSEPDILTPREVNNKYSDIFVKEPRYPKRYNDIQFASGSDAVAPEYTGYLNDISATIVKRKSCDISVIGHADTVGTNEMNRDLSMRRADNVFTALSASGVDEKCMDKRFYGESDLLVPTPDETDEPKNRRVEVEIR